MIATNHKLLLGLFNKSKPTPDILSCQMFRWTLTLILNYYDFKLISQPSTDALNRLSRQAPDFKIAVPLEVLFLKELEDPLLHASEIEKNDCKRSYVSRVLNWVLRGWPEEKVSLKF